MGRQVTFLTRPDCGLCMDGLARVHKMARPLRITVDVRDISGNRDLEDEYHLRIPVLLAADDSVIAEGPMNTWVVFRALAGYRLGR